MKTSGIFCISADNELNQKLDTLLKETGNEKIQFFPDIISPMNALQLSVPSLVILNAEDFPRHWKVFHQLLTTETQMILYTQGNLDEKELNKTKALGVRVIHTVSRDILEGYSEISNDGKSPSVPFPAKNPDQKKTIHEQGHVVISNDEHLFVFTRVTIDEQGIQIKESLKVPGIYDGFIYHDLNNKIEKTNLTCVKHHENRLFYSYTDRSEMEA